MTDNLFSKEEPKNVGPKIGSGVEVVYIPVKIPGREVPGRARIIEGPNGMAIEFKVDLQDSVLAEMLKTGFVGVEFSIEPMELSNPEGIKPINWGEGHRI